MRIVVRIIAVMLVTLGVIWLLQGVGVLPGSFMTGQIIWAIYGAPLALVGAGLVWWVNRSVQTR